MEKILNLLKDNQALRTLDTDKGTIVTNSTSDEAYLIAGSFWHHPRKILIIKNNQYEAFNLYKTLIELELMTNEEITWLNEYHQVVYNKLAPFLNDNEKVWLENKCKACVK